MAAIRRAGGALLRRIPAGSIWRAAVAGERPALRSLQQYSRGLHRPAAARAAFSTASTDKVDISSSEPNGCSKESEEDKKKRRRMAAMMLMKSHVTDDRESEMKSIDELFALLDPANDYSYSELTELQDRRSLFEQKKNAVLIALLSGDAEQEKEKMVELVDAGRLLRDALSGRYQLHGQRRDAPKLEEDVAEIKRDLKKMMEGQGKSVSAEPVAADSTRALLARVLADNTTIQEILDTLKVSVADNKAMLERFGEEQKDLKESVDTLDSTVDTLDDSVREGMQDLGECIGTEEESMKEAIEETVKEAIEGVEEKVKEAIEETVKDAMEEAVKEILEDSVKEIVEESVKEAMEETVKDVIEETLKEVMEETVKDIMEESVKETLQETVKETMKEVMEETVKDVMEETLKEVMEETVKDIMEESMKETIQETVKETMKETVKEIMEETVKDIVEETVKDAMESVETSLERVEESLGKLEDRA